jgi:hypothetical protein
VLHGISEGQAAGTRSCVSLTAKPENAARSGQTT